MFNEATFREILEGRSISRNVATLNTLVHDVINSLYYQSIGLQSKSIDWILYERDLRHERVNGWCPRKGHANLKQTCTFQLQVCLVCMTF